MKNEYFFKHVLLYVAANDRLSHLPRETTALHVKNIRRHPIFTFQLKQQTSCFTLGKNEI